MKQIFLSFVMVLFIAAASQAQNKSWEVPAKYKTMKSTVDLKDAGVIATGKELWAKQCKSCHGATGLGDGPRGAMLKTNPGDFSSTAFQEQTDGDIYYKTIFGFGEMPSFEKKVVSEADRWALVAYMRTLKK